MSENHNDLSVGSSAEEAASRRRRMQKMRTLDTLADGIAHDMSDLLHSARVYLQMTQEDAPDDHVVQDYLDQVLSNLGDVETLVERLLALSQESAAEVEEDVDLVAMVEEVLSLAESSFPDELALRTRFDEECRVVGNPSQLQQLVADLVTNAGTLMEGTWEEHPTVLDVCVREVSADPDLADQYLDVEPGRYAHFSVSNTVEEAPQTEPPDPGAMRADRDEGDRSLPAAREIVEAHDGAVTVRDEPGEGTTFNVYLPLPTEDEPSTLSDPEASGGASGRHVLVVDDDETVRTLEGIRLSRLGYEVTTQPDAHDALSAIREAPEAFDVVLIDYHMPEMNGLEMAHALREEDCEASVVLMTGLSAQISDAKARIVGIDHLLRKPVEAEELRELMARLA